MQEEDPIIMAKEKLLGRGYGMFDLVEWVVAENEILNLKPRLLREKIARILQVSINDIPYKTFCSWIDRSRKKHKKRKQPVVKKTSVIEKIPNSNKAAWENFKAIEAVKQEDTEPILKKVFYKS